MGEATDYVRRELLQAMYDSMTRTANYISEDNQEGVMAEIRLQVNLRRNFEELQSESND